MSKIVKDVENGALWVAKALKSSGYLADFSAESLQEIDRFFDEHSQGGKPKPGGLLAEDIGARIFALGAYVGEVIRQVLGGEWVGDDDDPRAEINVELKLANGTRLWPVQRVMKRFKNGAADGIGVYATAVGVNITRH